MPQTVWNTENVSKWTSNVQLLCSNASTSYNSIKLLTFNRCNRTRQRQSGTDPKPIYHFNPLLPRIVVQSMCYLTDFLAEINKSPDWGDMPPLVLDYIFIVDLKSKNLHMGTHNGQNS